MFMEKSMTLKEELVKYIFGPTHPTVALGEDGYIVYDFKAIYPEKLAVFVPIEIERSGYSNVFPKSFEAYFRKADLEIAHLARLMEIRLENRFKGMGVEYIPGRMLKRQDNNYTVFRFDELVDSRHKTEALCRAKFRDLTIGNRAIVNNINSYFKATATNLDGKEYLYWLMPLSEFFLDSNKVLTESVFAMAE